MLCVGCVQEARGEGKEGISGGFYMQLKWMLSSCMSHVGGFENLLSNFFATSVIKYICRYHTYMF